MPDEILTEAYLLARDTASRVVSSEAEDIAQDTVLQLSERDLSELRDWRSWVRTVARRRALDVQRRERRRRQILERGRIPTRLPGPSDAGVRETSLAQVLAVLSDRDADLLLAQLDGASNAELAERFGLANAATVAVTLNRIRRRIRDAFPSQTLRELLGEVPRIYDLD